MMSKSFAIYHQVPYLALGVRAARKYVSPRQRALTPREEQIRTIAYALKEADPQALAEAASAILPLLPMQNKIPIFLVPVPDSHGSTKANLALCRTLRQLSGLPIADVLRRRSPVASSRIRHQQGKSALSVQSHVIYAKAVPIGIAVLIDNVITSGHTLLACCLALQHAPDVCAVVYADARGTIAPATRNPRARKPQRV